MSYDTQCFILAASFMSDYPAMQDREKRTKALAQVIQDAIEDELHDFEQEDEARVMRGLYDAEKALQEDPNDPRSQAYRERMEEAADFERKRRIEEGR